MPNNSNQVIKDSVPFGLLKDLPGDLLAENSFQPETNNLLTNNKFRFLISRCPTVSYFCQRANIPSLAFGTSIQSNPTGVTIKRPGTSYIYEDLQVGFGVDENMKNWLELHNWIRDLGISYRSPVEVLNEAQKVSNAYLFVLNSAYRPIITFKFKNVYPTFLGGIEFDSSQSDTDAVISTVTFAYTHYEVEVNSTTP